MDMQEASMNFDSENVPAFLKRVAQMLDGGFGQTEIDELVTSLEAMEVNEETEHVYTVLFKGQRMPLKIHVFMDDIDAPDMAFFTQPSLAEAIDEQMEQFTEELGI